jgi:hypothetical protein
LCSLAAASEAKWNADLKTFFVTIHPYEHILMPPSDTAQSFVDGRLKLDWSVSDAISIEAHHAITTGTPQYQTQLQSDLAQMGLEMEGNTTNMMTGVGLQAPEALDLSWRMDDADLFLQGRTDRFFVQALMGQSTLRLGRQAISFGHGMVFNPMDLVQPFSIATIDNEYKAGIDALRFERYFGMTGQITGVVAYAGSWDVDGLTAVLNGNATIGWTDISIFGGMVRSDRVVGTGVATSIGAVGLHTDATLTFPEDTDLEWNDSFVRLTSGAFWRPFDTSSVTMEYYFQSLGAKDAADYLNFAQSERYARGELWVMGQHYLSLAWAQELTALSSGSLAVIVNVLDASALLSPSVSLSVSDEVQLVAGGYVGLGDRPSATSTTEVLLNPSSLQAQSEFGMMPGSGFIQLKSYF